MPCYQGVIFQSAGDAGWTNVFYINAANIGAAMTSLQVINSAMLGVQATTVFTLNLRVSDVDIKGDGLDASPTTQHGTLVITAPDTLAPLNLAMRFLSTTADNLHRLNHYFHGMRQSDIVTNPDGRTDLAGPYVGLGAMETFRQAVQTNTVNWQKRSHPAVTAPISLTTIEDLMSIRRVGRPFGQFRGRRRIA